MNYITLLDMNSNPYINNLFVDNKYDMQAYCIDDVNNDIYNHTHCIDVNQIMSAVHKLKPGNFDCIDNMYSDNLKNGTYTLYHMISILFTSMPIHGVSPGDLLLSTLVPIPKNKRGNKCNSNNYRQIAISSILEKIFDTIVVDAQYDSLSTDVLQFGFKKNSSTVICTSILLDTIEYYNENNTNCYLLLLDASKAFDEVELFKMLKDRNMCPIVLRLFMNMYVNQKIQVRWNHLLSSQHNIRNGVKQGGCLSPNLFSVYVNHLITKLHSSNLGCRYGNEYMGMYCYAGDISLLSPTFTGLKEMLKICEDFADDHYIIFNASKSQVLQFSSCSNNINMKPVLQMRKMVRKFHM